MNSKSHNPGVTSDIYFVIDRHTISLYHNSSVWLDLQDASIYMVIHTHTHTHIYIYIYIYIYRRGSWIKFSAYTHQCVASQRTILGLIKLICY